VPWPPATESDVVEAYSPALGRRLAEIAHHWAGRERLARAEVEIDNDLAERAVDALAARVDGTVHTWFDEAMTCYADCLEMALTEPRRAVVHLISDMVPAGQVWPKRQEWWLQTLFRLTECLHPTRAAVIDPRWRTADTLGLARGILQDRADDRLPILADALTDAGCDDEHILSHCRAGGRHPVECWALDLFGLRKQPTRPLDGDSGETASLPGRTVPAPGRHRRVTEGMAAIARLAGAAHPNLVEFARTGTLRDEDHRAEVQAELAALAGSVGSDAQSRPLTRLLEIMPSAPVGVCVQ
jgi:hypothetical protein